MENIKGKVALVTGGSQGLGAAIVEALAKHGVTTIIGDIKDRQAEIVRKRLSKEGSKVFNYHLDVSSEISTTEVINKIQKEFGRLDILVNNAGIDVTKPVDELTIEQWDRVLGVNLRGPFILSKLALEAMKKQKGGHIVNIASTAAKRAWANASAYHASKWGLLGMSHCFFCEARKFNVKVSAVISGGMRTPFILDRFPEVDPNTLQDPIHVAKTVLFILKQADETVIPEVMVLPLNETSWP